MKHDETSPGTEVTPERTKGRRRFLGVGSAVPPAVLSLFSQPAFGVICLSASQSVSANSSLVPGPDNECGDVKSPGYYANQGWPDDVRIARWSPVDPNMLFSAVFSVPATLYPAFTEMTLLQVAQLVGTPGSGDLYELGQHVVAAYVNIERGQVPPAVITVLKLQAMWSAVKDGGTYEVQAGGPYWNAEQVKIYLVSQHIAHP